MTMQNSAIGQPTIFYIHIPPALGLTIKDELSKDFRLFFKDTVTIEFFIILKNK